MVKWNVFLSGLCTAAVVLGVMAASARADVVTDKPASIVVFPKVIANLTTDTIIQLTNVGPNMVHARCFYVDAELPAGCTREAPAIGCSRLWSETDFTIWLTKFQPTHWLVSTGRPVDPTDDFIRNAPGAGIDPGAVPPVVLGFEGELKCVEVMPDGTPVHGNHLKGEATLLIGDGDPSDVSKYNAIGIQSTQNAGATGNQLLLNNPRGTTRGEYNACPQTLILNHFAEGTTDPVVDQFLRGEFGACSATGTLCCTAAACNTILTCGAGETCNGSSPGNSSNVTTELTLIPCSEDFENQIPGRVTIQFLVFNEFEERFSTSTTVTCWLNTRLNDIVAPNSGNLSIFSAAQLGSPVAQTRITPADALDGAVIGIAETTRTDRARNRARSAVNIHTEGDRFFGTNGGAFDKIILPDLF